MMIRQDDFTFSVKSLPQCGMRLHTDFPDASSSTISPALSFSNAGNPLLRHSSLFLAFHLFLLGPPSYTEHIVCIEDCVSCPGVNDDAAPPGDAPKGPDGKSPEGWSYSACAERLRPDLSQSVLFPVFISRSQRPHHLQNSFFQRQFAAGNLYAHRQSMPASKAIATPILYIGPFFLCLQTSARGKYA